MSKKILKNTRENRIITLFRALKDGKRRFLDVSVSTKLLILLLSFATVASISVPSAQSKKPLTVNFGEEVTVNIFPGEVDAGDWAGVENVLIQDLSEDALYQDFFARNSSYVPLANYQETVPANPVSSTTSETGEIIENTLLPKEDLPAGVSELSQPETLPAEVEQPVSDEDVEALIEEDVSVSNGEIFFGVFETQVNFYPLLQAVTTTPISEEVVTSLDEQFDAESEEVEEEVVVNEYVVENPVLEEEVVFEEVQEVVVDEPQPEVLTIDATSTISLQQESMEELEAADVRSEEEMMSSDLTEIVDEFSASTSPELTTSMKIHEITLSDFETPPLEKGQFVNGMQLRLSFAAQLKEPAYEKIPYVEVMFGPEGEMETVGIILIDDEVSNAINGGYFLFALPDLNNVEQLKKAQVTLRYHGSENDLNGMFLDSAWVEMDTKIVTEEDLQKRGVAENIKHLKAPELNTLVSDKVNFGRYEAPLFNLRYASQQNILTRSIRSLVGRDLVNVSEVNVTHRSFGLLGLKPDVYVTKDGLLTIEIPQEQLKNMRPGTYEVEIVLNEGGKVVVDTFNFEWGVLAINPDKSEYESGEPALISMGALTPSGHTVCDANLDLYITDPDGFISRSEVIPSGLCNGNNVIDVPDYTAVASTSVGGTYKLYLERLDENGEVMSFTTDTFLVTPKQDISIRRDGPTRIYPPASYPMTLTVETSESFTGVLTERIPADFKVSSTTARITFKGEWQELAWDVSIQGKGSKSFSYGFDAPDISPYLYNLGPANLQGESKQKTVVVASTTASTTEEITVTEGGSLFAEHRQWQIASDAIGNMLLFWDDGASVPSGWVCVSCTAGDPFYQKFIMGSSTYNATSGAATHVHTADGSVLASTAATTDTKAGTTISDPTHSHTYTPTIQTVSNLPEYRQLRVIRYNSAAGEPPTIPAGAIGIFDVSSSSLPSGWNRYASQDGRYVYGETTPATTGGSNTHTHTITGTTGAAGGTTQGNSGPDGADGAAAGHTHTVSSNTGSVNNEPPYITALFAKLTADAAPPNGLIAMWTEDVDGGWLNISDEPGDPFTEKFVKASTTYGTTGGSVSHTHADVTGITTSAPNTTVTLAKSGGAGSDSTHQHTVSVTNFSTDNHLPPYVTAVFGKRQGTNPVYDQFSSLWYVNNNTATPTDPWPSGATNVSEREAITSLTTPVKDGDQIRLRINVNVTNASSTVGSTFKLQYSAADTCSAASSWFDVGDTSSTTIWRGYNNAGVADHYNISTALLGSTTVLQTYEENGYATSTPNEIGIGDYGEWDFVLEQNGAAAGTNYCFRMVEEDGTAFLTYSHYPKLYTNEAPAAPTQEKLFDNEKTASTTPWFYFYATDAEGEKVHYQIQIDDNYDFGSTVIDRDTISESSYFENQVLISDKEPFRQGEQIKFTPVTALSNGTTYYWRVRAQDPDGSGDWGDWSSVWSFTVDTTLTASAWFQTETEQFDTNALVGVQTGSDQVSLISGSTTGTTTSGTITFSDGDNGTAWDSLTFNDTETTGDIKYKIEYFDGLSWDLIPEVDLSGNSTGFDTSPVSLLNLDVDTYDQIRILAVLTNSGGSPTLNDWTINWGYRVETPTIAKLFANEQTGTTTPTLQFTTTDPQNDSLTYEVSWSTSPDFTSSTTRNSTNQPTGFSNIDNGSDTDPFDSGADIQYVIQSADVLAGTTTYWWRVRAKDTTGDDAWSFWTDAQSFTVIPGTEVSTWFQTTADQFDTNILSGTVSLADDSVAVATTATEAMVVYGEGTSYVPKYRQWNGTTLSSEGDMQDIGAPVSWAVVKAATTREEYVAATVGTDGDVNAQVFSTGVWGNLQELTITMGDVNARGFDIAYETLSGDAMVAFCDGDADPGFAIWNGTSWTISTTSINLNSANNCEWIELEADPTSDEIIILSRDDSGSQYEAQVWNGNAWGNSTVLGTITDADHEGMALMYEESGGQALITVSDGNPARFRWDSWNGTAWAGAATQAIGDDFEWGQMARDIGSDEIILCYGDEDSDYGVVRWTGSAWAGQTELDIDGNAKNDPGFACVFEDTSGRDSYILTSISNTTQTNYYTWNTASWSTATQINTIGDTATAKLTRTGDALILGAFFDDPSDALLFTTWNGSSWSTTQTIESDASVGTAPFGHPYDMAARNSGKEGTTIVSPGIDFDDGLGPYWQEFSWNDNQPGSSEILYHVQYYTSTGTWAFIPDTDLPGNVAGTTTGPIDLSSLNTYTYNVIRPYAEMSCDGSNNCPTLDDWKVTWAGGITISGTIQQYDQSTNVASGNVAVAVNGVLQSGKTGAISAGTWSISNVTVFEGDIITIFVTGAADANEAVGVTRYDGQGDVDGMTLFERHVSLGSNDATTTPLTNVDVGAYDFTNNEDVFLDLTGSVLEICGGGACTDAELYIQSGTYFSPGGKLVTHDIENNGTLTATTTIEVNGSWDNNATTTMTGSTVIFAATSTTESIDSTGAITSSFANLVFGTTTGNATWTLPTNLDVNGNLTVSRGVLDRTGAEITISGSLTTGANGFWSGISTTTFDGSGTSNWSDANATLQNVGYLVVDGTSKNVVLSGNVAAESITIGANDTLDASASNYDITVYDSWLNQNNFNARSGEVFFVNTSPGSVITTAGDAFYDLTFNGIGGTWSFSESSLLVNNDFTVSTGTVNLPANGTTTIAGSFDATGGTFAHNNGTLYFTSNSAETITFDGVLFTNSANNITFNGSGSWTFNDTNATSSGVVRVTQGTANFPSGTLSIGETLIDDGGTFVGGTGTVKFYSSGAEVITAGGSSFNNINFDGTGSWSFSDTNVTATGDLLVTQGSLTLPSGTFSIGGSYDNNSTVTAGTGEVLFNSTDTGETVAFGTSALYDVTFNGEGGGWTITEPATTTNNFTLATTSDWTLASGQILSVGGVFDNSVGGASTTWTGSTLALRAGSYSINDKTEAGDVYATIDIAADTDIKIWNSVAGTYNVNSSGSLYSQDHNAADGDLYIWGNYVNNQGNEYWSYATDFDGADITGSERQADVRFADGASASISSSTFEIIGDSLASTTIANQGAGNYTIDISAGTTTANYYSFSDLGSTGVSFADGGEVASLDYGSYEVTAVSGSSMTLSSTTIDANPGLQIFNTTFSTSTAIAAFNVSQTDGTPSSYWWFRNGFGNLYGEAKDNDTGDPGSVRFDDSSLVITISGTVYSDGGSTPLVGGTCDGVTNVIRVVVEGGSSYTGSCSNVDGTYSVGGVVVVGDPTLTIYLDNASGGEKGSIITRTPTADITDADIYANRVIVRHEDVEALTIANLAALDATDDTDLQFLASTTSDPDTLTVLAGNELFIFNSSTFSPGGEVTLTANAGANSYDGTLYIDEGATFDGDGTTSYVIGGRLELASTTSTFDAASSTVTFNATTSGKSITSPAEITFHDLVFNGAGGTWNLGADIQVDGDMTITAGTVTGTGDITLPAGSLTGNGVLSMGGGTTTIATSTTLGGTTAWTFYNLQLGDGVFAGTTTPAFTSTTTISGRLTIATAHFLDAGSTDWDLAGAGTVFVEDGTFLEDTSTIRYSGAGANVLSTQYYNLDINSGFGSQTYTVTGLGVIVDGDLTVGGDAASTLDFNTNDAALDINGDLVIRSNGTFDASDSAQFTLAGSYDNNGVFNSNSGLVKFDGTGTIDIAAGNSSFGNIEIDATGDVTVSENATSSADWMLRNANSFTVNSGDRLAVGGEFYNNEGGAATTWTGSILYLFGGSNYSINAPTTTDTYATLEVDGTTQIRMWNSDASTTTVNPAASLYSQDHANTDGDLYIWGSYSNSSTNDYWDYATDFDGTDLTGGSERKVDVYFDSGASATYTGGSLDVRGAVSASTTIQNQGTGSHSLVIGGSASTTFRYYEVRDIDSNGLTLTGSPTVNGLSYGDLEVSINTGTAMTVGGTVITANPAKNFTVNRFALNGVGSGFNVTATGTSNSSWRFANHYGDIDGESFDVDPDGDPGYVAWDDSAALITISGNIYSDEGTTALAACDGSTNNVHLRVAGITSYTTSCNASTGAYSISNVSYGSSDSLIVYIDGETEKGATVSKEPVSNINNLDVYQNRVIVRHENVNPIDILDMADWDSSDDADIPFTAVDASPDTLTLPANTKLIVWNNKEFAPGGDVTLAGGGAGAAFDGTLELFGGATWTGVGTESLSVGGSMILGASASFVASNGTTTFTTTGASRTIDVNEDSFNNVAFTGSGSWSLTDATATFDGDVLISAGSVTLPSGTTTFGGTLSNAGGSFDANSGIAVFNGSGSNGVTMGGSDLNIVEFAGGNYVFGDVNATTSSSTIITSGDVTLPSGSLAVGGNFRNVSGTITHNTSELIITNASAATVLASSSDLYGVTFNGGGVYEFEDENLTLLDSLFVNSGALTLASGTLSIGGSFDATGGSFSHSSGTILFNSADGGEFIDAGSSEFYNIQISAPTGGYTLLSGATTTNNFTLASANSFTLQSGAVLNVEGVFQNSVGGSNTTFSGSTLKLDGANAYTINTKSTGGDQYDTLVIGAGSDLRMWNSAATTTVIDSSSSLYSQDNQAADGHLYIYGDFHISTTTEYWSYATDFDGASLSGSERSVSVYMAANATTSVDGGILNIVGVSGSETTITNQGSGTYALEVSDGTFLAQYYALRNMNINGLSLIGTPVISSLSYGDFELAVDGGNLISLSSTTLNANASLVITGNRFATTTAITGYNVYLTGVTSNAWTFTSHTGNLDGESFDVDGATACGSVRWNDSSCLITQQIEYRWRNDDGGIGVPASEWYDVNWDARKRVSIINPNSTTTPNAAVQLFVDYDSDMQADFDDLRFTASDGTTLLSHWTGSTTDSATAEVWVKVPSLTAEETTVVYMYYNNPSATTTSSSTSVFVAADDFEDDNLSEYSGQTSLFDTDTPFAFDGSFGLDNGGNETGRANLGGIYDNSQTVSQGETIRVMHYIDSTGTQDEVCTKFAIQGTNVPNNNYAICYELNGTDKISLVKNVTEDVSAATELDSSTATLATGWYEFEVVWGTDDSLSVTVTDPDGGNEATLSASDSTYSSGGFGFSFWFNKGGWDSFSSRPTLTTEPTIVFGEEQLDGGATWAAAANTVAVFDVSDTARLRVSVENTGLAITNQQYLLEYAPLGGSPSCEAVSGASYATVPVQSSCGTSPVCMQSSTNVTNGNSTFDLLTGSDVNFTAGEVREDPSNITGNLNLNQNEFTELEYVISPTVNDIDENLCFRVTNNGTELDTYLSVARLNLRFDPVVTNATINGGLDISLVPGTTTAVYATSTVTDLNGYTDIVSATATIYRSGATGGASCTENNNDCYRLSGASCQFTNCSGDSCVVECLADVYFHADPTDTSSLYEGQEWLAFIEVEDTIGGYGFGSTAMGVEVTTLRAIDVDSLIDYGSLAVNSDTGSYNASTTIFNQGNVEVDIELQGTDLSDGASSVIPADEQKFATSTFTYSTCGAVCDPLSSTTPTSLDVDLTKPTTDSPPIEDDVYWGINIPFGVNSAPHQGINVFTPISP